MDLNSIKGKAQKFLQDHSDQIEKGVDKVEGLAKSKIKGKDAQIDKVTGKIRDIVPDSGKNDDPPATPGA